MKSKPANRILVGSGEEAKASHSLFRVYQLGEELVKRPKIVGERYMTGSKIRALESSLFQYSCDIFASSDVTKLVRTGL